MYHRLYIFHQCLFPAELVPMFLHKKHYCVDSSEIRMLFNCFSYHFCAFFHFGAGLSDLEMFWPIWEKQYYKLHLFRRSRIVQRFCPEFVRDYEMMDLIIWSLLDFFLCDIHFCFSSNKSYKFGDCIVNDSFATKYLDCDFMFWVTHLDSEIDVFAHF